MAKGEPDHYRATIHHSAKLLYSITVIFCPGFSPLRIKLYIFHNTRNFGFMELMNRAAGAEMLALSMPEKN